MSNKLTEKPESSTQPSHLIGIVGGAFRRLPSADGYLPLAGGTMDSDAVIGFDGAGSFRANPDGPGVDRVCAAAIVDRWREGRLWYLADGSPGTVTLIKSIFDESPYNYFDATMGVIAGTIFESINGKRWACIDNTEGAAIWRLESQNALTFRDVTGEDAIVAADAHNRLITVTHSGATPVDLWVLLQSDAYIQAGVPIVVRQGGTGPVRINPDDSNVIIKSSSSVRVLSEQDSTCVLTRLFDDTWLLSGMPAGRYQLGNIGEGVTLDPTYGSVQLCYPLNTDTTFSILNTPVVAKEGDTLTLVVGYTNEALDLDFDASIKRSTAINALLPMTLEIYKSYSLHFLYRGGYWVIQAIDGPTDERID